MTEQEAFEAAMAGRKYGVEETKDAKDWFHLGWLAAENKGASVQQELAYREGEHGWKAVQARALALLKDQS